MDVNEDMGASRRAAKGMSGISYGLSSNGVFIPLLKRGRHSLKTHRGRGGGGHAGGLEWLLLCTNKDIYLFIFCNVRLFALKYEMMEMVN